MSTVSNATEWNNLPSTLTGDVTIDSPFTFTSAPSVKLVGSGITVNGGGYTIVHNYSGPRGMMTLQGGTITNITMDGNGGTITSSGSLVTSTVGSQYGTLTGCSITNVTISNSSTGGFFGNNVLTTANTTTLTQCHGTDIGNIGSSAGGFIGATNSNFSLTNCSIEITGNISGTNAGGFIGGGWVGSNTMTSCTANVTSQSGSHTGGLVGAAGNGGDFTMNKCYVVHVNSVSGTYSGGMFGGGLAISNMDYDITINDSYIGSDLNSFTGAFFGYAAYGSGTTQPTIVMNRCYHAGTSGGGSITAAMNVGNYTLTDCVLTDTNYRAVGSINPTLVRTDTTTSVLNTSPAYLPGDPSYTGDAENWSSSDWTPVDGSFPILDVFTASPWDGSYSTYNGSATLGAFGDGGGDPHIKPIFGSSYTLPHTEDTYMLYQDKHIKVKGKCWFLPQNHYNDRLNRILDIERKNKIKSYLDNSTFFKYVKIECFNNFIILDMDNLNMVYNSSNEDFNNHNLKCVPREILNYKNMNISKIIRSKSGLHIKGNNIKNTDRTISRTININTPDRKVRFIVSSNRTDMLNRNSIKLDISGPKNDISGCLVRQSKDIVEF